MNLDVKQISQEIEKEFPLIERLRSEIGRVVFGQETMIDSLIVALLCNQHVLLEGVPG
ncbi:MAG: ATPase, partial [Lentisphaerae bacterium]